MEQEIQIQALADSDIIVTAELIRNVISGATVYCSQAIDEEVKKYTNEYLQALVHEDSNSVIIAKSPDNQIIGFCVNHFDSGTIWIDWYGVHPNWRGRNIAIRLLDFLVQTASKRGVHKIWCDSRTDNFASIAILKKAGFEEICKLLNHWYHQDYALYQKFL
jgi:ribosomal protein S18 acetylase RimI-like enzyme